MSFVFNFPDPSSSHDGNDQPVTESASNSTSECASNGEDEHVEQCEEVFLDSVALLEERVSLNCCLCESCQDNPEDTLTYKISDEICLRCLDSQAVEKQLSNHGNHPQRGDAISSVARAAQQHSDLIPNVYEGGLKVWECAIDLMEYLHMCNICFTNKQVLELGCGAGLPGILAMVKGAIQVHFQDYNREVIEHYTIPNVAVNNPDQYTSTCRYFSGDWDSFRQQLAKGDKSIRYDVILTAETIYQPCNYGKLSRVFQQYLSDTGTVYLAAKSNYFGVGGGTRDFEAFVRKEGIFSIDVCHTIAEGVPREIMRLSRI